MNLKKILQNLLPSVIHMTLFCSSAWSFPEMVRHNYTNCTTCHISPTGGGVLNRYGRETSRELLSGFGKKNLTESAFAYGLVTPPDWLDIMGQFRNLTAYVSTPFNRDLKYIFMQNDLEAAVTFGKWTIAGTLGFQNKPGTQTFLDYFITRRHYLYYRPTDELSFRFGRFFPSFGINVPDHAIAIKRNLRWDESQETYNFESSWISEALNVYLTAILGRPDQPSLNPETGLALNPSISFLDHYKVGASYYMGSKTGSTRHMAGAWAILGFASDFFLLTEWDLQWQLNSITTTSGLVNYQRLDYEMLQGLHLFLVQDFSKLDFVSASTTQYTAGVGIQFFPRPHFELNFSYKKIQNLALTSALYDFAYLMFSFYL